MNNLHFDLVLLRASKSDVESAVVAALQDSKFQIDCAIDGTIRATYVGWHGFGITDWQTGSLMSIILKESDGVTAVSLVHRTRRILFVVGITFGTILKDEVDQFILRLTEQFDRIA